MSALYKGEDVVLAGEGWGSGVVEQLEKNGGVGGRFKKVDLRVGEMGRNLRGEVGGVRRIHWAVSCGVFGCLTAGCFGLLFGTS